MTIERAIIIGSLIVGASIMATKLIAPYQMASGTGISWRINTITGSVLLCTSYIEAEEMDRSSRCR